MNQILFVVLASVQRMFGSSWIFRREVLLFIMLNNTPFFWSYNLSVELQDLNVLGICTDLQIPPLKYT